MAFRGLPRPALALALLVLMSCTTPGQPRSGPSATASSSRPAPSTRTIGVFLNARQGFVGFDSEVAIVDLSGRVIARARFTPRTQPFLGNAGAVLPPQGQATSRGVYFADRAGVIRLLQPSGDVKTITTIPITSSQQEISFAVSPDDREILASRITFPKRAADASMTKPFAPGPVTVDVFRWQEGQGARRVSHEDYSQSVLDNLYSNPLLVIVGWNDDGPIGLINTTYASQYPIPSRWFGDAVHVSVSGNAGGRLCRAGFALSSTTSGTTACQVGKRIDVVDRSGRRIWAARWDPGIYVHPADNSAFLSPDGLRLCLFPPRSNAHMHLFDASGRARTARGSIACRGWVSSTLLIGTTTGAIDDFPLGTMSIQDLTTSHALGISGTFVGVVS